MRGRKKEKEATNSGVILGKIEGDVHS